MKTGYCLLRLLAIAALAMMIQCAGKGSSNSLIDQQPAPSMVLNPSSTSIPTGASLTVTAIVSGSASTSVAWAVDDIANGNTTVGTITGSGTTVTYTAPSTAGSHTVKATSVADSSKSASAKIDVLDDTSVSVSVNPSSSTINTEASLALTAMVTGSTNTAVTWTIDDIANGNATVGTITGSGGTITYTAPSTTGNHTVKATSAADNSVSDSATITVQAAPAVSVSLSPSSSIINTDTSLTLTATVTGTTNTSVTWMVDNVANGNATVGTITGSGGTITYTAPSSAASHTVTATSVADDSRSASAAITVQTPPATSVSLNPSSSTIDTGTSLILTATVRGSTDTSVTWTVDDIANGSATAGTITGSGNTVTYTAPSTTGSHAVKAISVADTSKSASATITVEAAPVVSVSVSPSSSTISTGSSQTLTATVTGSADTSVAWMVDSIASGNATVGTISGSGNTVTYKAPTTAGSHTVKATSVADTSKSASATIKVQENVSISLSPSSASITTSASQALTATVSGSTNTSITWTVDTITNGNATVGTITDSGNTVTYTAPATAGSHTVTATSVADTSKSASATIKVQDTCATAPTSTKVVSVKDSGAKGDGVTNDTAAIQKAVDAIKGTGGTVLVPAGTYMVNPVANSNAGIRLGSNMTLRFETGAVWQALSTTTSNYVVLMVSGVNNVNIVGGTIVGNRKNNTITDTSEGGDGIKVVNSQYVVLEGVTSKDCWEDGFYVGETSQNVTLCNVVADSNRRHELGITCVDGMVVRNSTFKNGIGLTEKGSFTCGTGIDIEPNPGETVNNVQFTGCTFAQNQGEGFAAGPSVANRGKAFVTNIVIDGNTVAGNGIHSGAGGISISNTSGHKIRNNTVKDNLGDGIVLKYHADSILVTGNTVTGTKASSGDIGYGILLYDTAGDNVTGNTVTGSAACGIRDAYPYDSNTPNTIVPNTLSNNDIDGTCR